MTLSMKVMWVVWKIKVIAAGIDNMRGLCSPGVCQADVKKGKMNFVVNRWIDRYVIMALNPLIIH